MAVPPGTIPQDLEVFPEAQAVAKSRERIPSTLTIDSGPACGLSEETIARQIEWVEKGPLPGEVLETLRTALRVAGKA
jgi:hypothetical protein